MTGYGRVLALHVDSLRRRISEAIGAKRTCRERRERVDLTKMPSRPGEFHPKPLTDPDLTLSRHPARAIARRLPPSIEHRVPPGVGWTQHQFTRAKWRWPAPFAPRALPRFITTAKQSAPSWRIGTFGLAVGTACTFSLRIAV